MVVSHGTVQGSQNSHMHWPLCRSQPWKKVCLQQKASGNHDYPALKPNILDFLAPSFVQF